ncbi:YciI family protein [Timonella senegalensis]|uniref:YciI family protein n=1 Tax=Timonella senegalensis TaxID=1465825 RepID=UPI00030069B5|nr:YciI family protein [Timonella senegalensis]
MKFLINVIDTVNGRATGTATAAEMADVDEFSVKLKENGHWIIAAGLCAPANNLVIDGRPAEPSRKNGPLHDTTEFVSGFWIINAEDRDAAIELATQGSKACNRKVELREFL